MPPLTTHGNFPCSCRPTERRFGRLYDVGVLRLGRLGTTMPGFARGGATVPDTEGTFEGGLLAW
jgi:hypothetical protein